MSFILGQSDEQRMLADTLRRFAEAANDFETRRKRLAEKNPDRLALWRQLAEIGGIGLAFPEERGGFGGTPRDIATMQEALTPSLFVEPVIACAVTAGHVLLASTDTRADALITATIAGERIPILAHAEGFDPFAIPAMTATKNAKGFVLNGRKPAVRHADVATDLLVSARLDDGQVAIFLVEPGKNGVGRNNLRLVDAAGAADLEFRNVAVEADSLLALTGNAIDTISDALEWTLVVLCAETAALIASANRATFDYLNVREQFGQKLVKFQALQHRAADMAIAQTETEALASDAIDALGKPPSAARSRRILFASLSADAAGRLVGHEAIQFHGGMGVSDELVISHYGRRFTAIRNQVATADVRQARILAIEEVAR